MCGGYIGARTHIIRSEMMTHSGTYDAKTWWLILKKEQVQRWVSDKIIKIIYWLSILYCSFVSCGRTTIFTPSIFPPLNRSRASGIPRRPPGNNSTWFG